eukprot:TRINITY_DN473_c1_g3_i1.p1 TRINITY_DN473_c1_g3~~TRINITY_DN473_c1_g3_i1.p1  ORF type:complete len:174 (+),score=44.72 TRINITY_DN473_c1_g3_i1:65-586(+)
MSNNYAKKLNARNKKVLKNYLLAIIISNLLYLLIRGALFYSSFGYVQIICWLLIFITMSVAYGMIFLSGNPPPADGNRVVAASVDLEVPGMLLYAMDVIILSVIIQVIGLITDWAILLYISIPIYIFYKMGGSIFSFLTSGSGDQIPMDDQKQGRGKRKKEKGERQKVKYYRR